MSVALDPEQFIESLTGRQRLDLLKALMKPCVGPLEFSEGVLYYPVCSGSMIKPGERVSVSARSYRTWKPRRLVILEQELEWITKDVDRMYGDVIDAEITTGMWWWKRVQKTISRVVISETMHCRTEKRLVPRNAWSISMMFIGAALQFESNGDLGGELFSPTGTTDLICDIAKAGLDVTLQVKLTEHTSGPAPFVAVILGEKCQQTIEEVQS